MSAALKPIPGRMTLDEFLAWDAGDLSGVRWQLVDGEPVAMAPASENHALLQGEIARLIGNHLHTHRPSCRMLIAPGVVPRAQGTRNFRIPDIGVTCSAPTGGPVTEEPVLLVEVLSPSNEAETWTNVWAYSTIPSVVEILIVRATRMEAELLRRLPDGHWPVGPVVLRAGDTLTLDSIGMSAGLAALYATTPLGVS